MRKFRPFENRTFQSRCVWLFLLLAAVALSAEARSKKTRCEGVPLVWSPTTTLGELGPVSLTGVSGVSIEVLPLEDARKIDDLQRFGENREEDDEPVKIASTPDDIPAFATTHFRDLMGEMGFRTVESGGDVVISGELRKFFVTETSTYEGDVQILVRISRGSETVYEGLVGGASSRFGRSYKAENFYETLSDALLEATHKLVTSDEFLAALRGEG